MNIITYLNNQTKNLTEELQKFMLQVLPDEVRCVEVIIFDEALPRVPFGLYFLDRFKAPSKTINNFKPLAKLQKLIDSPDYISREDAICDCLNLKDKSELDACMDIVEDEYNIENRLIARWFSDCWLAAGGNNYPLHAFIVEVHGKFKPINLKTGQPIKHMQEYFQVFDG